MRRPLRARNLALPLLAAACALPAFAGAATAPANAGTTPGDVAATQVYLRASYELDRALLANVPRMQAAARAFVSQLRQECPDVLAHAEASPNAGSFSARVEGEESRARTQVQILEEELASAQTAALDAPDEQAFTTYRETVRALSWSNAALAPALRAQLEERELSYAEPPPACADMQAWVASGRTRLSTSTRAFVAAEEAQRAQLEHEPEISVAQALRPYETPEDRALIAHTQQTLRDLNAALTGAETTLQGGRVAVGLGRLPSLRRLLLSDFEPVGHGKTAAGGSFEVQVVKRSPRSARTCRFSLQVDDSAAGYAQERTCLPTTQLAIPRVRCVEGLRTVEVLLPASVRRARLSLRGGRQITSHTISVPARLGGPVAFYYQAVSRGPAVPVSLTELGAAGTVLGTLELPAAAVCVRHQVRFLHHGIVKLARGKIPGGEGFAIKGEAYRYNGPVYFALSIELERGNSAGQSLSGMRPKLFASAEWSTCSPAQYEIVYGLLKAPEDRAVARVAGVTVALSRAAIPARLHAHGVLVYGVFTKPPEVLIVENARGKAILSEHRAAQGESETEYCEGFDEEPGRPPPGENGSASISSIGSSSTIIFIGPGVSD